MRIIKILALLLISSLCFAGGPVLWGPNSTSLSLESAIQFLNGGPGLYTGSVNPSSVATSGAKGSLYLDTTNGHVYIKQDAGSSTNWTDILLATTGWDLLGNGGTTAGTNFVGTTDGVDLVFKTNNIEQLRLKSGGAIDPSADIIPNASNTYNLGSNATRWKNIYNAGTAILNDLQSTSILVGTSGNANYFYQNSKFLEFNLVPMTSGMTDILYFQSTGSDTYAFPSLGGSTDTVLVSNTAQTMSHKEVTDAMLFDEQTLASTPAAGKDYCAPKSDGQWYCKNSSGTVSGGYPTVGAYDAVQPPVSNGITITAGVITAQSATRTVPGMVSTTAQSFAGDKDWNGTSTFNNYVIFNNSVTYTPTNNNTVTGSNADIATHATDSLFLTNGSLVSIASINNQVIASGHIVFITNKTGNTISLINNYASPPGTSAVILTGLGQNLTLANGGSASFIYDGASVAWRYRGGDATPLSAKGDLLIYSGSQQTNQVACANGQQLQYDSTQTNGVKCVTPASGSFTPVIQVTATSYSVQATDDELIGTAALNFTLPDCTGLASNHIWNMTNASVSGTAISITAGGANTFDSSAGGGTVYNLTDPDTSISVICNKGSTLYVR